MVMYGYVWLCMVMYGYVWLCWFYGVWMRVFMGVGCDCVRESVHGCMCGCVLICIGEHEYVYGYGYGYVGMYVQSVCTCV